MKKLMIIIAILAGINAGAQVFPSQSTPHTQSASRGLYGSYLSIGYTAPNYYATIVSGTVTPVSSTHPDTLKSPVTSATGYGTDSGYAFFSFNSIANRGYQLSVTTLTGTLAGAAILQGSFDGQIWYTLTGNTTYCTGCVGASATLTGAGTTTYTWTIPKDNDMFTYHQIFPILSGTCTATFSAKQLTGY